MNIPATSILGFVGLIALGLGVLLILAGLDIFKVKQITIKGGKRTWTTGAVLVFIGIVFLLPDTIRSSQAFSQNTTFTPTPTLNPIFTPSPTPESGIPVITALKIREDTSSGSLVIYQDIYFYDSDGDTNFIQWKVLSTTNPNITINNTSVNASSEEQKAGTFTTGTWKCISGTYSIRFQATLLDSAGHESNPIDYSIECK